MVLVDQFRRWAVLPCLCLAVLIPNTMRAVGSPAPVHLQWAALACSAATSAPVIDVTRLAGVDRSGHASSQPALGTLARHGLQTLYFPAGTYVIDSLTLGSNTIVKTDGTRTVFRQSPTGWFDTPILKIAGSHVCIEAASYAGNAWRDWRSHPPPNEFNHAVAILPTAAAEDITIVALHASNVLGDALYIGGTTAAPVRGVRVGSVWGTNVFRSGVSIVGGSDIDISSIDGDAFGYRALNIEPNPGSSQTPDRVHVAMLRASQMQVAGDPQQPVGSVRIDRADFDARYQDDSSPGYSNGRVGFAGRGMAALIATNASQLVFGSVTAKGYEEVPFLFGESEFKSRVQIGRLSITGSGQRERRRGLLHEVGSGGLAALELGAITLRGESVGHRLFSGNRSVLRLESQTEDPAP